MSKITVKHYLNKRLKPVETIENKDFFPVYLSITYDRMNIRKPSAFYHYNGTFFEVENESDFKKIDEKYLFKLNYEIDLYTRCIKYFIKDDSNKNLNRDYFKIHKSKKYNSKNERLNFLNSYLDFYKCSIYDVISSELKIFLESAILPVITKEIDLLDKFELKHLFRPNNPRLYEIIEKYDFNNEVHLKYILFSRFHSYLSEQGSIYGYDMPYIDWKEQIGQPLFKEYLNNYTRITDNWNENLLKNNISTLISYIEEIIFDENYIEKTIKRYDNIF